MDPPTTPTNDPPFYCSHMYKVGLMELCQETSAGCLATKVLGKCAIFTVQRGPCPTCGNRSWRFGDNGVECSICVKSTPKPRKSRKKAEPTPTPEEPSTPQHVKKTRQQRLM